MWWGHYSTPSRDTNSSPHKYSRRKQAAENGQQGPDVIYTQMVSDWFPDSPCSQYEEEADVKTEAERVWGSPVARIKTKSNQGISNVLSQHGIEN